MSYTQRRVLIPAVFLLLSSCCAAQQFWAFRAEIGKENTAMLVLHIDQKEVRGIYFYKRDLKDFPISGGFTSDRDFYLEDKDENGHPRIRFEMKYGLRRKDCASQYAIWECQNDSTGIMHNVQTGETLPISMHLEYSVNGIEGVEMYGGAGGDDPAVVEKNAQGFYYAVLGDRRDDVAKYVSFPLRCGGCKKPTLIKNRQQLLQRYSEIFTRKYVAAIAEGIPHHMFSNWRGIMIGNGEVWFNEKGLAFSLNLPSN